MINLIRNELTKIFSKKAIYIYTICILGIMIGLSVLNKNRDLDTGYDSSVIQSLEDGLDKYDLNNEQEREMFIGDKVLIDVYELSKNYEDESPEKYYIDNYIEPLILEKYNYMYLYKDMENVNVIQAQLDEKVKLLNNFDWKKIIQEDKVLVEQDIRETESLLLVNANVEELVKKLEDLKVKLWCLNYRLDNELPYSFDSKSMLV